MSPDKRKLKEIEQLAKIGSWELDLVNNELSWSDEIYRIFDTDPQSFGATYEAFLNFVHPEDRELIDTTYTASVKNKEPYGPICHRLLMKSGDLKFVEERGVTEYNEIGEPIRSIGVVQDVTERVLGEEMKTRLKEKEILLKEIYHRVKNNLQLISSFISIQSSQSTDENVKSMCTTVQNRIRSISLIHEQLMRSNNLKSLKMNEYVKELVLQIEYSMVTVPGVKFLIDVCEDSISIDEAVPCGLIINEIISNSLKYAFVNKEGVISIKIYYNENKWDIEISDNGKGVADVTQLRRPNSFGMEMIHSLTEQLDGEISIESTPGRGVKYSIRF